MITATERIYTDRSRQNNGQECLRERYLGYHWGGVGLRKVRATIPLVTGQFTHDGLADMLKQVMQLELVGGGPAAWMRVDVDRAVDVAVTGYKAELKARGLDIELGEDGSYVADEQLALVEGMLRAYAMKGLGELMDQYKVLEVENEDVWPAFATLEDGTPVDMQARADGLLQERSSGDLYILSFKTAAGWDHRKDNDARHDVQGLSEAAVVERRLGDWWTDINHGGTKAEDFSKMYGDIKKLAPTPEMYNFLASIPDPPRIMGVQMVHLIKGRRERSGEDGPYLTQSHLLRGWYKEGVTEREYAWRFKWEGPDTWPDSGRPKGHTLGKGWVKFDTWTSDEVGGVKGWLDMLASGTVQPEAGNALDGTYVQPLPYFRQDQDMLDWVEQAQSEEVRVNETMRKVEHARTILSTEAFRSMLNKNVPQNRRSCDFPSKCSMQEICFGDATMLTNPTGTGLYQIRVPHHTPELMAVTYGASTTTEAPKIRPLANDHEAVQSAANEDLG